MFHTNLGYCIISITQLRYAVSYLYIVYVETISSKSLVLEFGSPEKTMNKMIYLIVFEHL